MDGKKIYKTLTLTLEQLSEIEICMGIRQIRYEQQRELWARAALEKNPDGTPRCKNAARNIEYIDKEISKIKEIVKLLQ